ncbi:MAG TPA: protein-methionine-sulfoxide reductase heme-binding subunit MsrQ [Stellaceae bacterium]|jgi:sulfoxide reductase heme-binding subunit YedZ|nr:protein-methionine-sulfoxide reductase heme-binding subunit MsrQ [Stellaceae bacterium]
MKPISQPWKDYSGRTSPLKLAVFVALFCPALWVALAFYEGWLGARPLNEAIHQIGLWTIRLIFVALAVTPMRQVLQWSRLLVVRRMVGVAAFAYGCAHLTLYTADQAFDLGKVASEIVLRFYLTIGFVALVGLAGLAATSTDGIIRRMGARRWMRLHRLIYLIAVLAVIHYFIQSKLEVWEPTIMAGIYAWLMGYRVLARRFAVRARLPLRWVAVLGMVAGVLTACGEIIYFSYAYHAPAMRVLAANWSLQLGVRPAIVVLALGLTVWMAGVLRTRLPPLAAKRRPGFA